MSLDNRNYPIHYKSPLPRQIMPIAFQPPSLHKSQPQEFIPQPILSRDHFRRHRVLRLALRQLVESFHYSQTYRVSPGQVFETPQTVMSCL